MEFPFTPSPDVIVLLNALLDILEHRRARGKSYQGMANEDETAEHATRSIKIILADISLPHYFSQANPEPRLIANEQLIWLEKNELLQLTWITGETGHLLQSIAIPKTKHGIRNIELFHLLSRTPQADDRSRLEQLLLADKFRFQDDWRARAISQILQHLKAGKSPAPFNPADSNLTIDLLTVLQALPTLTAETPYRVFSVQVFNDSKRFEAIKNQLVSLARRGNPEWSRTSAEEVLRELNLVANPGYIHLAGSWHITTESSEILDLGSFTPSIGFPAAQTSSLRSVGARSVLCIENLTTFHQYTQKENEIRDMQQAVICTYGNPSPAIRRILRLLPERTPIFLWSDLDYGGFNILAQLRKQVSPYIQPCLMDIATFEKFAHLSRPFAKSDMSNLRRLLHNPILKDVHETIEHLIKCGLKLEQEAIQYETRGK